MCHRVFPEGVRHTVNGVESLDRFHEVEGSAQYLLIRTHSDKARVWNIRTGKRREHSRLASHGLIAVRPFVARRSSQYVRSPRTNEAEKDVLRPPGEMIHGSDRPSP